MKLELEHACHITELYSPWQAGVLLCALRRGGGGWGRQEKKLRNWIDCVERWRLFNNTLYILLFHRLGSVFSFPAGCVCGRVQSPSRPPTIYITESLRGSLYLHNSLFLHGKNNHFHHEKGQTSNWELPCTTILFTEKVRLRQFSFESFCSEPRNTPYMAIPHWGESEIVTTLHFKVSGPRNSSNSHGKV